MITTASDPLIQFAKRFLGNVPAVPVSVFAGVVFVGDFAQLVLLREGEFQAQLCLCKAGAEIPDHGHPNVEQLLVYVTGEVDLRLDGKPIYSPGQIRQLENGLCSENGAFTRIAAGQPHGATIGAAGGAFITIQRWLSGMPSSVENNWEGPLLGEDHKTT